MIQFCSFPQFSSAQIVLVIVDKGCTTCGLR